jgi:hypothetical protein
MVIDSINDHYTSAWMSRSSGKGGEKRLCIPDAPGLMLPRARDKFSKV